MAGRSIDASALQHSFGSLSQQAQSLHEQLEATAFAVGWALSMQNELHTKRQAGHAVAEEDEAAADAALQAAYADSLDLYAKVIVAEQEMTSLENATAELTEMSRAFVAAGAPANKMAV